MVAVPTDRETLLNALGSIDALIVYSPPFDETMLPAATKLKVIACHSCPQPLELKCREQGIAVKLVPTLWDTVADLTLALLFAAARNIPQAHAAIRAGQWLDGENLKARFSGLDVFGKTLGILGLGQIGSVIAKRVQGFHMKIMYSDINRKPELEKRYGLEFRAFRDVLAESDILIVLLPLNQSTRGIIGKEEFALMKSDCILVNSARGAILDEAELCRALKEKRIAAAGLDVFTEEPLKADHPLLDLENVVLSPHLGGSTKECDMVLVESALGLLGEMNPPQNSQKGIDCFNQ